MGQDKEVRQKSNYSTTTWNAYWSAIYGQGGFLPLAPLKREPK